MKNIRQSIDESIRLFFSAFNSFLRNDYKQLQQAYQTNNSIDLSRVYSTFIKLENSISIHLSKLSYYSNVIGTIESIELNEKLEQAHSVCQSIRNLHRWCRSSRPSFAIPHESQKSYVLGQNEPLETIASQFGTNRDEEALVLAYENNLLETTSNEGQFISIEADKFRQSVFFTNAVDSFYTNSNLGKDIAQEINFDENDLYSLSLIDTYYQTVNILLSLKRGDNRYSLQHGLDQSLFIGVSYVGFAFPQLIRQLEQTFASDDSVESITPSDVYFKDDILTISIAIQAANSELSVERELTV